MFRQVRQIFRVFRCIWQRKIVRSVQVYRWFVEEFFIMCFSGLNFFRKWFRSIICFVSVYIVFIRFVSSSRKWNWVRMMVRGGLVLGFIFFGYFQIRFLFSRELGRLQFNVLYSTLFFIIQAKVRGVERNLGVQKVNSLQFRLLGNLRKGGGWLAQVVKSFEKFWVLVFFVVWFIFVV